MKTKMGFDADKLKQLRLKKGLTQYALASHLQIFEPKINRNSVWQWESGIHQPSFRYLSALAKFFGVQIDDFTRH